jgi:hypothetical protein
MGRSESIGIGTTRRDSIEVSVVDLSSCTDVALGSLLYNEEKVKSL